MPKKRKMTDLDRHDLSEKLEALQSMLATFDNDLDVYVRDDHPTRRALSALRRHMIQVIAYCHIKLKLSSPERIDYLVLGM